MRVRKAIGTASLWAGTVFALVACGGGYGAGSSEAGSSLSVSSGILQSSVISVQSSEGVLYPTQHDSLAQVQSGVVPRLSAEAVRQALLASGQGLYLKDASKLTVKLGLYTNTDLHHPDGSPTANLLVYDFSGGSGDCGPRGGPAMNTAVNATPTPAQKPCTSVVIAEATTGTVVLVNQTGGGDVQQPAVSQSP
jgi:hypothetical protein